MGWQGWVSAVSKQATGNMPTHEASQRLGWQSAFPAPAHQLQLLLMRMRDTHRHIYAPA